MRDIFDVKDRLPDFSEPRYDISKGCSVVYLDRNENFAEFTSNWNASYIFECPLIPNLEQIDIDLFKNTVRAEYKTLEAITSVYGGNRGMGVFAIFNKVTK